MITRILLDMDGVIANFFAASLAAHSAAVVKKYGIKFQFEIDATFPRGDWDIPKLLGITAKDFWDPIDNYDFWINVPAFDGARAFVEELQTVAPVTICTSASWSSDCAKAKIEWIENHIGRKIPAFVCHHGAKKSLLANPEHLLIDDYIKNIHEFRNAGGAVHHVLGPWNDSAPETASFFAVDYASILSAVKDMCK
jgi:5'(3')-deoxyribonucleotidase